MAFCNNEFFRTLVLHLMHSSFSMFTYRVEGPYDDNEYSGLYRYYIEEPERERLNRQLLSLRSMEINLENIITEILHDVTFRAGLRPDDRIQFRFVDVNAYRSIPTPLIRIRDFNPRAFLFLLSRSVTSQESLYLIGARIEAVYALEEHGGGHAVTMTMDQFRIKKRAIKVVDVTEDCFFHCAAYAKDPLLLQRKKKRVTLATARALKRLCRVVAPTVGLFELSRLESVLELNIYVVQALNLEFIRTSDSTYPTDLYLLYHNNHFDFIYKAHLKSLFSAREFCFQCMKAYKDISHSCQGRCRGCKQAGSHDGELIHCDRCGFQYFNNQECELLHIERVCLKKQKRCSNCLMVTKVNEEHRCFFKTCRNCSTPIDVRQPHQCFIQPIKAKDIDAPSMKYLFYDFESYFDGNKHKVGLAICYDAFTEEWFEFCGLDALEQFCRFLFDLRWSAYTVIAHNGSRYDLHFIKQYMLNNRIASEDLVNGNGILYMSVPKLSMRFLDSVRFIPMALREFPKTFGLTDIAKGFFPYRFFTTERFNYVGPLPAIEYFDVDRYSPDVRHEILEWHQLHKEEEWNLMEVCRAYCRDDVRILTMGCLQFRSLFMDITEQAIDPFRFITIASVCNTIYRRFHMPANTIALLDEQPRFQGDGDFAWHDRSLQLIREGVYEIYLDCYDNGCSSCFDRFSVHATRGVLLMDLFKGFQAWKSTCPFTVVERWSHDYKPEPLPSLRDAFFGGRTEVFGYYSHGPIQYLDFTSLYPAVQSCSFRGIEDAEEITEHEYPVGHYVHWKGDEARQRWQSCFGFLHCQIWCPPMHIPLLPVRDAENKLVFPTGMMTGIWTSVEITQALQVGYVMHEVLHCFHFERRSSTLFRDYVDVFLKIKQEASGYDGDIPAYVESYLRDTGIRMDAAKIKKNPGLRFIAKLCLNTLWGKFGQRNTFPQTIDVFSRDAFNKIIADDMNIVDNVELHEALVRTVTYHKKTPGILPARYTNIAIAAFTTAYARLRLYSVMLHLGDRLLYCDTDSVIFKGPNTLYCGPLLGDLTSELDADEVITDFVATAPKSYAYMTSKGKQVCKVKGFSLNFLNQQTINFGTMKRLLESDETVAVETMQFHIGKDHCIATQYPKKRFQVTNSKRVRVGYETEPIQL